MGRELSASWGTEALQLALLQPPGGSFLRMKKEEVTIKVKQLETTESSTKMVQKLH